MHSSKMMGMDSPGDQKIPVPARNMSALRLAMWRSKVALESVMRQAQNILDQCAHEPGCPGKDDETAPCIAHRYELDEEKQPRQVQVGCRDREMRASALVMLNEARRFAPHDARALANEPYYAPTREFFSEVIAELASAQAEIIALRAILLEKGIASPEPTPHEPGALAPVRSKPQLPAASQEIE